jgi:hypothetical protein
MNVIDIMLNLLVAANQISADEFWYTLEYGVVNLKNKVVQNIDTHEKMTITNNQCALLLLLNEENCLPAVGLSSSCRCYLTRYL